MADAYIFVLQEYMMHNFEPGSMVKDAPFFLADGVSKLKPTNELNVNSSQI